MTFNKSSFANKRWPLLLPAVVLLLLMGVAALFIWPVQKRTYTVYATLQTQEKIEVHASMQSRWPWAAPDRLTEFRVLINGKLANVPNEFFKSILPLDFTRKLMLSDWRGYPEILMWGKKGSSLQEVHWRFMNDSFSELRIKQGQDWKSKYHSEPLPPPEDIVAPPPATPKAASVAPIPAAVPPTAPKKNHTEKHK
jgi:hypothetical protein